MNRLIGRSKLFMGRNASTILSIVAGAGVVATAIMAAKDTPKAMKLIKQAEEEKEDKLTKTETVIAAAPAYIPTIVTGVATIVCIFGANTLNRRQQAALTSAYALLDQSYKEYKRKVDELYGEEAGRAVREEIAKDHYEEYEDDDEVDEENSLFYDLFSDRYFTAKPETVLQAEYHLNRNLTMRDYAYLNEFYEEVGLEPIDGGYQLGWSSGSCFAMYWQNWIDFGHEKVILDDTMECTIISFKQEPIVGFEDYC